LKLRKQGGGRALFSLGKAPSIDCTMQGGTLPVCTVGDEVNPCVAGRRSEGVSIAYDPADATATHYLLLQ